MPISANVPGSGMVDTDMLSIDVEPIPNNPWFCAPTTALDACNADTKLVALTMLLQLPDAVVLPRFPSMVMANPVLLRSNMISNGPTRSHTPVQLHVANSSEEPVPSSTTIPPMNPKTCPLNGSGSSSRKYSPGAFESLVDVGPVQARRSVTEPTPPFKPCMRISRTRLTSGLSARSITQFSRCQEVCPGSGSSRAGDVIQGFRRSRGPSAGSGLPASCAPHA